MDSNRDEIPSDSDLSESFEKRFLHLLDKDVDCDCEFVVGSKNIVISRGHKLLFSAASEVFNAMFNSELKEEKAVRIEDLDPQGFQGMRQFIYTGETNFASAIQALLVYIAARKYLIPALTKKCISYIRAEKHIQPSEVLEFYEICKVNNIPEFEESCYEIIQQKTDEVVESEYFLSAEPETIELILKSPSLKLKSEIDVLHHFDRWVMAEAERRGIGVGKVMSASGSIHNLKKHIRFLTISSDDFFTKVASSSLLTQEEKIAIACNLKMSDSKPMPESLSLERQLRNFIPASIEPDNYSYKHTFEVSIDDPASSCDVYRYNLNTEKNLFKDLSSKITYTRILKYICFQFEFQLKKTYCCEPYIIAMVSKLIVVSAKEKCKDLILENEIHAILDWSKIQEQSFVFAKIPISKLRNLRGNADTSVPVFILGSFNIFIEKP